MRRAVVLLSALWVLASLCACSRRCDPGQLERVATLMEDRTPTGRDVALAELGQACPSMPTMLERSLEASYGHAPADLRATVYATRFEDDAFAKLHARTCAADRDAWTAAFQSGDRDVAVFEICDLARYQLLDDDEEFYLYDFDAYMLYEWLVGNRADPQTARTVVRGLLASTASPAELMARCATQGELCLAALAAFGVDLPTAEGWPPPNEPGDRVLIRPDAIEYRDLEVELHEGGVLPPSWVEHHEVGPLLEPMTQAIRQTRERLDERDLDWEVELDLYVDASVEFDTVLHVLFTAARAGYLGFRLAVRDGSERRVIRLDVPRRWSSMADVSLRPDRRLPIVALLGPSSLVAGRGRSNEVVFDDNDDCAGRKRCFDPNHVRRWFVERRAGAPDETATTMRVAPGVDTATFVEFITAARGADCENWNAMYDSESEIPDACRPWWPRVDFETPASLSQRYADTLQVRDARARRAAESRTRGPKPPAVLATFNANADAVRDCLRRNAEFILDATDGSRITVMFGPTRGPGPHDQMRLLIWSDGPRFANYELEACVAEIFDKKTVEGKDRDDSFGSTSQTEVTFEIDIGPRR